MQDGSKLRLLGDCCEGLFSGWEGAFSAEVFDPIVTGTCPAEIAYGSWALKFSVSVSWRILRASLALGWTVPSPFVAAVSRASAYWSDFLLDRAPDPGPHEQHLVLLNGVQKYSRVEVSRFFARYALRSAGANLAGTKGSLFTWAKMGPLLLIGFIEEPDRTKWQGTKIRLRGGAYQVDSDRHLPIWTLERMNADADEAHRALAGVSPAQRAKIESIARERAPDEPRHLIFRALAMDCEISGDDAFCPKE